MTNTSTPKIFLVDDDAVFLKLLAIEFREHTDYTVETFPSGELCFEHLSSTPDVVVLDYHLDGINKTALNGVQTLDKIKGFDPEIPVVMLSSQDSIDVAISCMHHKAADYITKSETAFMRLKKSIELILDHRQMHKQLSWYMDRM